jgi:hypothetical protein
METKILTSPHSINKAPFQQQYKKFGQVQFTPCVDSPISAVLPPCNLPVEIADLILEGNFQSPTRFPDKKMQAVHDYFAQLQQPHYSDGSVLIASRRSDTGDITRRSFTTNALSKCTPK